VVAVTVLTTPHNTIRKVLRMEYSEVAIIQCYEMQNFLPSLQIRDSYYMLKRIVSVL